MNNKSKIILTIITISTFITFCASTKSSYINTQSGNNGQWDRQNIKETVSYIKRSLSEYFKTKNINSKKIQIKCERLRTITSSHIDKVSFMKALKIELNGTPVSCCCDGGIDDGDNFTYKLITMLEENSDDNIKITFTVTVTLRDKANKKLWKGKKVFVETVKKSK